MKESKHIMATPSQPAGEHPSTYFVQDRFNQEELTRLKVQDAMLTAGMGGVLAEQTEPDSFRSILDVGCGAGGWLLAVAKAYPETTRLVGVDVSKRMVTTARSLAADEQLEDRVEFQVMDTLRQLDFRDESFDLVNERLGASYLRTWDWPKLLKEFRRVARPEATVRLTEGESIVESSSAALLQLNRLLVQSLYQAGHYFSPDHQGMTNSMVRLMHQHGLRNVQTQVHTLEYHAGSAQASNLYEDTKQLFRTIQPFLHKWTQVPADYEQTYQQMLCEMQQPDFTVTWRLLTVWGLNPSH